MSPRTNASMMKLEQIDLILCKVDTLTLIPFRETRLEASKFSLDSSLNFSV
jgi:hypothetical protein